jgi:hypothetical protein
MFSLNGRYFPGRRKKSINFSRLRIIPNSRHFFTTFYSFYFLFLIFCVFPVFAQTDDDFFPEFRPTPKIETSEDEKKALEAEKDLKKYTKLAIDLMEERLKKAENLTAQESFREMLEELGGFHALMNTAVEFLIANSTGKNGKGKMLDNLKRFEMALRAFTPRIETIRRESPERFDAYIIKLLRNVRAARAKALEPFFSDSVVPDKNI